MLTLFSISGHSRLSYDYKPAIYNFARSEALFGVSDRKWRHQLISRPQIPISLRCISRICCVLFINYVRFSEVYNRESSHSVAWGRIWTEVTSPVDIVQPRFPHRIQYTFRVRLEPSHRYTQFLRSSLMVENGSRPLGAFEIENGVIVR